MIIDHTLQQIEVACWLGCFIISPFLKLKMLGALSDRIWATMKKFFFDYSLF